MGSTSDRSGRSWSGPLGAGPGRARRRRAVPTVLPRPEDPITPGCPDDSGTCSANITMPGSNIKGGDTALSTMDPFYAVSESNVP